MKILETDRLLLRTWQASDLELMCKINQDPKVMEYFPALEDRDMTKKFIDRINTHFDQHGYSLYATQRKDTGEFIGFIGLLIAEFQVSLTPATEIGWRLASEHWGKGYATEGAKAVLHHAFCTLNIPEIFSFSVVSNEKSRRVMEKIGLKHDPSESFDHPKLPEGSPLRRHVLYHLGKSEYEG